LKQFDFEDNKCLNLNFITTIAIHIIKQNIIIIPFIWFYKHLNIHFVHIYILTVPLKSTLNFIDASLYVVANAGFALPSM
ncbi:MAG: hypothetical protein ACRC6N_11805, partial [Plesiomonas sp.]|uniref:hypothetical protein n=1 Tax=Plesiomonas sp. TaxID=2486279 RepID=UPI003F2C4ECF